MASKISSKTEFDIKESSNPSLSKSAQKNYADNAEAGVKDDGAKMMPDYGVKMTADPSSYRSSMSRHWHQSNLLKENPIVNHATEK